MGFSPAPSQQDPEKLRVILKMPRGERLGYEPGVTKVFFSQEPWPVNSGLIPGTYDASGQPLETIIISSRPLVALTEVQCNPIGGFRTRLTEGLSEHLVAVDTGDPTFSTIQSIEELDAEQLDTLDAFLRCFYRIAPGASARIEGLVSRNEALDSIQRGINAFQRKILIH